MVEQVSREKFHRELTCYLQAIAAKEGLSNMTYTISSGSKTGDNFIGVVKSVAFSGERLGVTETKTLIYKCQPDGEGRREYFRTDVFFHNEAQFYNYVLPAMQDFQQEKGVAELRRFSSIPTNCYHAGEVLILDDMRPQGYVMRDRRVTLDVEHCRLVMRELGKMHALSFALRDQKPDVFKSLTNVLKETLFVPISEQTMLEHFEHSAKIATDKFVELSSIDQTEKAEYELKMRRFQSEYYASMVATVSGANAEPYAVFNHGDCWTNNMLFKYAKESKTPEEICFIDFQMARYSSPVTDIAYFLYSCTDFELRREHYDDLMKDYHNSLSRFLNDLGSDPEKLFPYSAFQDQLRRFSKFGIGMAFLTIPLFTCNSEDMPDLDAVCEDETISAENKLNVAGNANDGVCWALMNGVIVDMVERGFIC